MGEEEEGRGRTNRVVQVIIFLENGAGEGIIWWLIMYSARKKVFHKVVL